MEGVSNLLLLVVRRSADKQPVATSGKSYDRINLELSSIQEKYLFFFCEDMGIQCKFVQEKAAPIEVPTGNLQ